MAEVTVFVDDAVRGTLPPICAKDGVDTPGRLRVTQEIGRSNRLGILWILLLFGPLGWIALLFLMTKDTGERLAVEVPYSDAAYGRILDARRLRLWAVGVGVIGGVALAALTVVAHLGTAGAVLTIAVVVAAIAAVLVAEWRLGQATVSVDLDGSRRWVTLGGVHPAFVTACRQQELAHHRD